MSRSRLMDEEDIPQSPSSPGKTAEATSVLQLQQFLDEWHYRILHSSLGRTWNRKRVLSSMLDILELNGLECSPEERAWAEERLCDENMFCKWVVSKMPISLRENFEHLAMQLQLVVQMATRVRKGLEDDDRAEVQAIVEEADGSGVGQAVLKQAVVTASEEVANIMQCQETWIANTEARIDRLLRGAETAEQCNQQLLAIEAQLETYGSSKKDAGKKVLMGLAEKNDTVLLHSSFSGWHGIQLKAKADKSIHDRFQKQIDDAEQALFKLKEARFSNIRGAIVRKGAEEAGGLNAFLFKAWAQEVILAKKEGGTKAELEAMERRLKESKSGQAEATKRLLTRMNADKDGTLLSMCYQGWVQFVEECRKNKEFEDQVRKAEEALKAHMDAKKDAAKAVLDRISGGTDTGLMANAFRDWLIALADMRKTRDLEEELGKDATRFKSMQMRQLGNAKSVQNRVNEQMNSNLLMKCVSAWVLETKVNVTERYYTTKLEGKRRQLNSVQTLFRGFAKQLDEGLGAVDGDSSDRTRQSRKVTRAKKEKEDPYKAAREPYKGGQGDRGLSPLPDIRSQPVR